MASLRTAPRKPYSRPAPRGDVEGQWLHDKAPTGPAKMRNAANRGPIAHAAPVASINSKLVVSNLHYEITPKDLSSVFGTIGTLVREPLLRYDRSGRSIGSAIIAFETAVEATRAKKQLDGVLAKGQPMSIAYDTMPPRAPRAPARSSSAPTTSSLLNRIQKPPLADRLSRDDSTIKAPSGPRAFTGGPVRNRPSRGANNANNARAPKGAPRGPKKVKTAEELDKELDAFMGDAESTPVDSTDATTADVEMV
ncbi:hypothetical protein B0H34DRAFT_715259 [Crassisporium funariophilum]|nr:hypothetical protein B0H34DRAFT_715259 [Crassisporium funariophilum]